MHETSAGIACPFGPSTEQAYDRVRRPARVFLSDISGECKDSSLPRLTPLDRELLHFIARNCLIGECVGSPGLLAQWLERTENAVYRSVRRLLAALLIHQERENCHRSRFTLTDRGREALGWGPEGQTFFMAPEVAK